MENGEIQGDSESSKEDFFSSALLFRQEFIYFAFCLCDRVGCPASFGNILLGLVSAQGPEPFFNANFPQWALASWSVKKAAMWPLSTTHLQLYCYLVTVPPRKPNKIFKVFFEKRVL